MDLVEVVEPVTVWINVYADHAKTAGARIYGYTTRERADKNAALNRIACLPVTYRPGEGLDA
jgi:hypothetical protein